MDRVKVRICLGTACFVQGGADLLLFEDFLAPELLEKCDIEASPCLNQCRIGNGIAPYVEINGIIHDNVDQDKLIKLLQEVVNAGN